MSALNELARLLKLGAQEGFRGMNAAHNIDALIAEMKARSKAGSSKHLPQDHLVEAVQRFWENQDVQSFRDAYLLSWGLCVSHPGGACVLEDSRRFLKVLEGVDRWASSKPRAFRRCYLGLMQSYFQYDVFGDSVSPTARTNWTHLRKYLRDQSAIVADDHHSPDWVKVVIDHNGLFGENPCEPYVDTLLRGDASAIDNLCDSLGIGQASWFHRELLLAQVNRATQGDDTQFVTLLPRLLERLASNEVLRDRGLVLVLNRYSKVSDVPLHQELRDLSVKWWGNPWLASNETRWGGAAPEARAMVADWLKLEFIETFFTKLAEDGLGDRRRMEFWKRYVKEIREIEFALGSTARDSHERDFVSLRKKMTGLIRNLDAAGTNNAFIMTMGDLVAVEFSGMGNALYGYDARKAIPFDTSQPLRLAIDAHNSLKQKSKSILHLSHKDGIRNWDKWEDMFEATLRQEFGINLRGAWPAMATIGRNGGGTSTSQVVHADRELHRSGARAQPYTRQALDEFANLHRLQIDDKTRQNGNLWVRGEPIDSDVPKILMRWGFRHRPGKGWWK